MSGHLVVLTPNESARLEQLEAVVERGLQTFIEVGMALALIRDRRLYAATHDTFANYLRERWGISRSRGYRLIQAAEVAVAVSPNGDIEPPANEAQARELVPLVSDEPELREVWRELREFHGDDLTADLIRDGVSFAVRRKASKENAARKRAELATVNEARKTRRYPHAAVAARKQPVNPEVERGFAEEIKRAEREIEAITARIRGVRRERAAYHDGLWDKRFSCSGVFWEPGQRLGGAEGCWVSEADTATGGLLLRYSPPAGEAAA
jgi:hypothetical protein